MKSTQPVKDAVAWLDGRKLRAGREDRPHRRAVHRAAGPKPIVLADAAGTFATLTQFEHHAEDYRLDAQFHIEREQLLARREATLAVRAALLLGDARSSLSSCCRTRSSRITTTTLDGIARRRKSRPRSSSRTSSSPTPSRVPERLATLTVTLTGKVEKLSAGGEKASSTRVAPGRSTGSTRPRRRTTGTSRKFGDSYVFELLGKNGEPIADQQVVFHISARGFAHDQTIALRTDEKGRVMLGTLAGIAASARSRCNGRPRGPTAAPGRRTSTPAREDIIEVPLTEAVQRRHVLAARSARRRLHR